MKGFGHIWHVKGKPSNKNWTHWKRASLIYGESVRLLGTQWLCDEAGQLADQANPDEQQFSGYVRAEYAIPYWDDERFRAGDLSGSVRPCCFHDSARFCKQSACHEDFCLTCRRLGVKEAPRCWSTPLQLLWSVLKRWHRFGENSWSALTKRTSSRLRQNHQSLGSLQ